jgi:hypothetical protein
MMANPDPIQTIKEICFPKYLKLGEFSGMKESIFKIENNVPINTNKRLKININTHIELMNLLRSILFALNFAKAGIKTDEKIMADIPVTIVGIDKILKYISICADAPKKAA